MKRSLLLVVAGSAAALMMAAGCRDKCDSCSVRHQEKSYCDGAAKTAEGSPQAPVESRTEVAPPGAAKP